MNKFIRRGALVNAPDTKGWTALPLAARFNDGPVMQALIAAGADATLKNNDGQTADDLLREISGESTRIESVLRRSASCVGAQVSRRHDFPKENDTFKPLSQNSNLGSLGIDASKATLDAAFLLDSGAANLSVTFGLRKPVI